MMKIIMVLMTINNNDNDNNNGFEKDITDDTQKGKKELNQKHF